MAKSVKKALKLQDSVRSQDDEETMPSPTPRSSLRSMKTMTGGTVRKRTQWGQKPQDDSSQSPFETPNKSSSRPPDLQTEDWKAKFEAQADTLARVQAALQSAESEVEILQSQNSELRSQLASQPANASSLLREKDREIAALREAAKDTEEKIKEKVNKLAEVLAESDRRLRSLEGEKRPEDHDVSTLQDDIAIAKFELEGLRTLLKEMMTGKGFPLAAIANRTLVLKDCGGVEVCVSEMKAVKALVTEVKEALTRVYFANRKMFDMNKSVSFSQKSSPLLPQSPL